MVNNLLSVWSTIGSVLLAILILLVMITVHEFGHYVAGKILKFKIDEFSIGFGPALFKRRSRKTGELFALRLIPLGGYCAFAGEDGLDEEPPPEPFEEMQEGNAAPGETAAAEVVQKAGESLAKASAAAEETGESAERAKKAIAAPRPAPPTEEEKAHWFVNRRPWQRVIVLLAGALMNYLLAVLLIIACFFAYGQTMIAVYETEPTAEIAPEYCLQDRDILLEAEGKSLYLTTDIARALNGKRQGEKVSFRVSRLFMSEAGESYRGEMEVEVQLRADVTVENSADYSSVWRALGIRYEEEGESGSYLLASAAYRFGFWETLGRSFMYSFKIAGSIFQILGELLTGRLGLSVLGGPVSTIAITSQVAGSSFRGFLEIAGYIGVNLAVFNLLPIPALDGSKVVFTVIEWIRGKPVNRKVEAVIHFVGLVLLLGFAVLVDILQFV